ncbi:50S ribosomal protein L25/general stress protein Ctc [Parahaliea sp. F7430]|uniref:Large ribosomal subunit protein bL25 n=1 Tax=Sediminihaliea albiluteola TaxID=2758564 RepID=A0A7W2TW33_9GAMM|nr:50S ribosomal protein L25/general stress protein Ctc [Sediminihaliea albiluteola]MBA6413026.1 50S ribosomal protein L25/general stress protein Ctc [Sediminihaliea albiluteola]
MSDQFEINAELREDLGKGASRRLRRLANQIPAIIYGGNKEPLPLSIIRKDLEKQLEDEIFYTQVLTINIGKKKEKAILKDLQRHPARNDVTHVDFMRIEDDVELKIFVQIHFLNEESCPGVKLEGGMVQYHETEIEVLCLPADIPDYIELDMKDMNIGDIVHLSELKLPEGVTSVALALGEDHDLAIASVVAPRGGSDDEEEDTDAPEADEVPSAQDDEDDSEK